MMSYTTFRRQREAGQTTCVDTVQSFLSRIDERKNLNAFLAVDRDGALKAAQESDRRFTDGTARPLEGMVIALKDNFSFKGLPMTCGSKILEGFAPAFDATVVERLRDNGAIFIGKTNMDEFAMGSSNENSAFGPVLNPINDEYVPGGSSGGSATAVAASLAHVALGSDTGGSIRQPAALCGVVGFKPTYGRISRYGLVAFASSLDQIGPISATVEDTALVFDVMSGKDSNDATTAPLPPTQTATTLHDSLPEQLTVAVLPDDQLAGSHPEVLAAYRRAVQIFEEAGARIIEHRMQLTEAYIPTYYIVATAEASSNLARFDGVRYGKRAPVQDGAEMMTATRSAGFGTEVKRRIMLGTYVLSSGYYDAYYNKALKVRRLIHDSYTKLFGEQGASFLLLPTSPTPAFKRGEKVADPIAMYLSDMYTVSANLAGNPAISIPAGQSQEGLPLGVQLQADFFREDLLLRGAAFLEQKLS